jgi:hypothetical protein
MSRVRSICVDGLASRANVLSWKELAGWRGSADSTFLLYAILQELRAAHVSVARVAGTRRAEPRVG